MPRNDAPAHILIRIEGNDKRTVDGDFEAVGGICIKTNALDVLVADTKDGQQKVWEG